MVVVGVLASASLAGIMFATAAQGGSGGVGSGGGGDGGGGGDSGTSSKYERIWHDFSAKDKHWAHQTSRCESGEDPNIHGRRRCLPRRLPVHEVDLAELAQVGRRRTLTDYSWKTQAVVAVLLKKRDGAGHWPNCG